MNEREQRVQVELEEKGWTVYRNGAPDFFAMRAGKLIAVEVKSPKDKLKPVQERLRKALEAAGIEYRIEYPDGVHFATVEAWCLHCKRAPKPDDHPPLDHFVELGEEPIESA